MRNVVLNMVGFLLFFSSYSIQGQTPSWSWKRSPLNSATSVITDLEKDRENNIYVSWRLGDNKPALLLTLENVYST